MAKKNNAVAKVPTQDVTTYTIKEMPSNAKGMRRLNLPQLVKMDNVPIGAIVSGKIEKIIDNFTGRDELRGSKVLQLNNNGTQFMFPMTGVVRKAIEAGLPNEITAKLNGDLETADKKSSGRLETDAFNKYYAGKTIFIKRLPDGKSVKYKKIMFMFDVFIQD